MILKESIKKYLELWEQRCAITNAQRKELTDAISGAWKHANSIVVTYGSPSSNMEDYVLERTTPDATFPSDTGAITFQLIGGSGSLEPNSFPNIHCRTIMEGKHREIFFISPKKATFGNGEEVKTAADIVVIDAFLSLIEENLKEQ